MYSKTKRAFCLILAVLVLCFCVLSGAAPKAEAANPALVLTVVKWVLSLAGITFASAGAAYEASQAFYNSDTSVSLGIDGIIDNAPEFSASNSVLPLNTGIWASIVALVAKAKAFFDPSKTYIQVPTDFGTFGNVKFTYKTDFIDAVEAYSYCPYNYDTSTVITTNP